MNVIVVFFLLLSAFCPTNHTFLLKSPYCILNYRRIHDLQNPNANSNSAIFNKPISSQHFTSHVYDPERLIIPSPLDRIIDVNLERNAVVYEGSFNRDLGFDIVQGPETPVVGKIKPGSRAVDLGIQKGDNIIATSATIGGQMWSHDTVESVESALMTRFVLNPEVIIRFERKIQAIPQNLLERLRVPYYYFARIKRPLGLHVKNGENDAVIIEKVVPGQSAFRSRLFQVGDQITAVSATWGNKLWDVKSVESFIVAVKMRSDDYLTLKCKRMIPLSSSMERLRQGKPLVMDNFYLYEEDNGRKVYFRNSTEYQKEGTLKPRPLTHQRMQDPTQETTTSSTTSVLQYDTVEYLKFIKSREDLQQFWRYLQLPSPKEYLKISNTRSNRTLLFSIVDQNRLDVVAVNKLMSKALSFSDLELGIEIFQRAFSYDFEEIASQLEAQPHLSTLPPKGLTSNHLDVKKKSPHATFETELLDVSQSSESLERDVNLSSQRVEAEFSRHQQKTHLVVKDQIDLSRVSYPDPENSNVIVRECLAPNNFILPIIIKLFARKGQLRPIEYLIPWMEIHYNLTADIYSLSSLLHAYAKFERVETCEYLFYQEIPRRNLTMTVVTINSFMYLYTKVNRPMEALKMYKMIKREMKRASEAGRDSVILYNEYTFSILIKCLLLANNPRLQQVALEIVDTLPSIGIYPTIDHFNQFFEYYSSVRNYKQIKTVIRKVVEYNRQLKRGFPRLFTSPLSSGGSSGIRSEEGERSSEGGPEDMPTRDDQNDDGMASFIASSSIINTPQKVELNLRSYSHILMGYANAKLPRSALMMYSVMRRSGIAPDKYIYMAILKALYWLKDYLSSIQIIEEMVAKGKVLPDEKHYAQAMRTCLIANKGELAEELIKFYLAERTTMITNSTITGGLSPTSPAEASLSLRSSESSPKVSLPRSSAGDRRREKTNTGNFREVPSILCTSWLQSLLQQSKIWEAMTLYHRINEDHYTKMKRIASNRSSLCGISQSLYLANPAAQTFLVMLRYQIQSHRYPAALTTIQQLLQFVREKHQSVELPSFMAVLGTALGPYLSSSSFASNDLLLSSFYDHHNRLYSKYYNTSSLTSERSRGEKSTSSHDPIDPIAALDQKESDYLRKELLLVDPLKTTEEEVGRGEEENEIITSQNKDRHNNDNNDYSHNSDNSDNSDVSGNRRDSDSHLDISFTTSTTKASLHFLLQAIIQITHDSQLLISSELYCDFIKALLVKHEISLASQLLELRVTNQLRLHIVDVQQLQETEEYFFRTMHDFLHNSPNDADRDKVKHRENVTMTPDDSPVSSNTRPRKWERKKKYSQTATTNSSATPSPSIHKV